MPPYLLDSVCSVVEVFYEYAERDGDCFTLNRRELKKLIQKEFSEVLQDPRDPRAVELVLQLLDLNGDCLVDFNEFLILVFQVAMACYSFLQPSDCREEETRGSRCDRDPRRDESIRHQPEDSGEERTCGHERQGSYQTRPGPADSSTRREERREYRTPVHPVGRIIERSRQAHNLGSKDDRGRIYLSREAQKWKDRAHEPEPQRNEASCGKKTEVNISKNPHKERDVIGNIGHKCLSSKPVRTTWEDPVSLNHEHMKREATAHEHKG
ncbi:repetin-like [Sphaerodactylus townsendi]|uniref:Uncharacterized protein n=1 Tax=Sphaerodactylus townsendi TaxID=933632 RepID=A0ACB8G8L1_9SAUR|nr:repetin-like [Sphaerodactylus townsendi]